MVSVRPSLRIKGNQEKERNPVNGKKLEPGPVLQASGMVEDG
jgi:hypothetical protein